MGHSASSHKVSAHATVLGGSGGVDAIRLSYRTNSCWGKKWKEIASFSFPRDGRSFEYGVKGNSSNVANVPLEKLREKDGETPVKLTCLAAGVPAFRTELTLADLLHMLEVTRCKNRGTLFFILVFGAVQNIEAKAPAFVDVYCNGRRCGGKPAGHPVYTSGPGKHGQGKQAGDGAARQEVAPLEAPGCSVIENVPFGDDSETKGGEGTVTDPPVVFQADQLSNVNKRLAPDGAKREAASPVLHTPKKVVRNRTGLRRKSRKISKVNVPESSDIGDTRDKNTARGSLWDLVTVCAGAVAVVLMVYNAWLEYNSYW